MPAGVAGVQCAVVLGVPLGEEQQRLLVNVRSRQKKVLDLCGEMSDCGHPHEALRLLQVSGINRYQHVMRVLPPAATKELLHEADTHVQSTLCRILDIDGASVAGQPALDRAALAVKAGGMQITRMEDERHICYYASLAATLRPILDKITGHISTALQQGTPAQRATCSIATAIRDHILQPEATTASWAADAHAAYEQILPLEQLPAEVYQIFETVCPTRAPEWPAGARDTPPSQPAAPPAKLNIPPVTRLHLQVDKSKFAP